MDLTHDERKLLENYRSLGLAAKGEVADLAATLAAGERQGEGQCRLPEKEAKRPEAVEEPLVTE